MTTGEFFMIEFSMLVTALQFHIWEGTAIGASFIFCSMNTLLSIGWLVTHR